MVAFSTVPIPVTVFVDSSSAQASVLSSTQQQRQREAFSSMTTKKKISAVVQLEKMSTALSIRAISKQLATGHYADLVRNGDVGVARELSVFDVSFLQDLRTLRLRRRRTPVHGTFALERTDVDL